MPRMLTYYIGYNYNNGALFLLVEQSMENAKSTLALCGQTVFFRKAV